MGELIELLYRLLTDSFERLESASWLWRALRILVARAVQQMSRPAILLLVLFSLLAFLVTEFVESKTRTKKAGTASEVAPKEKGAPKGETMPNEHPEIRTTVKAFAAKPIVVRSFAWAAIFAAIGLMLHPDVIHRDLVNGTVDAFTFVYIAIAVLFGLAAAKLTEPIYARTDERSTTEIVARRFVLTDSEGRPLGFLGQADGDAFLALGLKGGTGRVLVSRRGLQVLDGEDNPRAMLEMTDTGPRLALKTELDEAVLELADGDPVLSFKYMEGKEAVRLGTLGLNLVDTTGGDSSVSLTAFEEPTIEFKDSEGRVVWKAPTPA
jgi:hypothetical protein